MARHWHILSCPSFSSHLLSPPWSQAEIGQGVNADPKESLGIFPGFLCTTKGFRSLPSVCQENEYRKRVMFCKSIEQYIKHINFTSYLGVGILLNRHVSFDCLSFGVTNNSSTLVNTTNSEPKKCSRKVSFVWRKKVPKHVFDVFDSYIQVQCAYHIAKPILIQWENLPLSWCPEKYCIKSSLKKSWASHIIAKGCLLQGRSIPCNSLHHTVLLHCSWCIQRVVLYAGNWHWFGLTLAKGMEILIEFAEWASQQQLQHGLNSSTNITAT